MYDSGICFATIPCVSFRGVLELNKVHCTPLAGTGHWGLAVYSVLTPSLTWLAPQSRFTHRGTTSWGSRVAVQSHAVVCPRLECRASAFGSRLSAAILPLFIKKLHLSLSVFYNAFSRCTYTTLLPSPPQALVLQMYTAILDSYFLLMPCAHIL